MKISKDFAIVLDSLPYLSFYDSRLGLVNDQKSVHLMLKYDFVNYRMLLERITEKKIVCYDDYYSLEVKIYD